MTKDKLRTSINWETRNTNMPK